MTRDSSPTVAVERRPDSNRDGRGSEQRPSIDCSMTVPPQTDERSRDRATGLERPVSPTVESERRDERRDGRRDRGGRTR
ncbi:hypothetical protein C477_13460 [Haloterrigena salina JCM 13891]|uniref:Uncharacterized protein n=1 Tax=Haloterrigena salina JCM 13891 TaxID=1227488 RepID=M0C1T3_9EURY|nr:hypothetical protein C477_13460 [Haloterrigena salina JCM 13891]